MEMAYERLNRTERMILNSKRRRNREIQQHILILVLSVLLIAAMADLFFGTKSHAETSVHRDKCYLSVQVCSGQTLQDVASEYYTSEFKSLDRMVSEIRHINNMDNDQVTSGLYIIVPCYTER